jgi:hypothetical protein
MTSGWIVRPVPQMERLIGEERLSPHRSAPSVDGPGGSPSLRGRMAHQVQSCRPPRQRLIDRVAAQGLAKIEGRERRRGQSKQASSPDQLGGKVTASEREARSRTASVPDGAPHRGNAKRRPEGDRCGSLVGEHGMRVPPRHGGDAGSGQGGDRNWRIDARQHSHQIAGTHPPLDGTRQLGMVAARDHTARRQDVLDVVGRALILVKAQKRGPMLAAAGKSAEY